MSEILQLAVVGHTNTGKTSLLRTLARDEHFGEVRDAPATTQHVEALQLLYSDGEAAMVLYDTPGLEDPLGLLDLLESLPQAGDMEATRFDLLARIQCFLDSAAAREAFEQEAKVLRQMLVSDAALYVIDCREPILGKYLDELTLLAGCAIPLMPVLNFISDPFQRAAQWREHMARLGLHAVVTFDTVVYDEMGERRLFEKLRTLVDRHEQRLQRLIEDRHRHGEWLRRAAAEYLAELYLDVAACQRVIPPRLNREALHQSILAHQEEIRAQEQATVQSLLRLFRFSPEHYQNDRLMLINGTWGMDLFNPDALRHYGLRAGGGVAAGAASGLALDAATGGFSLGLGTLGGALLGGLLGTSIPLRQHLWNLTHGVAEWRVSDETLRLLMLRQQALVLVLLQRGHAAQAPVRAGTSTPAAVSEAERAVEALPKILREARLKPQWSRLNPQVFSPARQDRQIALQTLTESLLPLLQRPAAPP